MTLARHLTVAATVIALALAVAVRAQETVMSQEEAERFSHDRHVAMKDLGRSMRTVKGFLSGRNSSEEAAAAAALIVETSAVIPSLFPAGTGIDTLPKTGAKDAIWERWDDFTMAAQLLGERAAVLQEALASGDEDAVKAAFGAVAAEGCGGCHDVFKDKDH